MSGNDNDKGNAKLSALIIDAANVRVGNGQQNINENKDKNEFE